MMLSDSELWARSRAGDTAAFGLLFDRHHNAIYSYCFRRLGDWSVAEDALSVVFLEAWRRRDKVLPDGKVLPWLYGIATNVIRSQRRTRKRYAAALSRLPDPKPSPDFAVGADERLDDVRRVQEVLRLVSKLSKRDQDVLALVAWQELCYEDAAAALEIPVGTVRSRLSRARFRLRELDARAGHEETVESPSAMEALKR